MKKMLLPFCSLLLVLLVAGCSSDRLTPPTSTATYASPVTAEPVLPTFTPLPSATPTPNPTPTPYQPIAGKITVDDMRLRRGPGFLFETIQLYPIDQTVYLLGRSPGNNWFYVRTMDGLTGWMKEQLIDLDGNFYDAPEVTPDNAIIVHGRISQTNGAPASDLALEIHPEGDENTSHQDVGVSDVTGRFYIYLPADSNGNWILSVRGYGCESSAVDSYCSLIGQFPPPQVIKLPDAAQTALEFQLISYK